MGIRETLNENPAIVYRATIAMIAVALISILWYVVPSRHRAIVPREYFSDDDGKTWFSDNSSLIAPFDHEGKQAVLAKVFRCRNGTKFVGYLEKFTDEAQKRIIIQRANGHMNAGVGAVEQGFGTADLLIKKPAGDKWVSAGDPRAVEVETVHCPDGEMDFEPLLP